MKVALKISTALIGVALLSGCAGYKAHKGAVVDPQLASAIQAGTDNKASVEKTLGRPSFVGEFTPNRSEERRVGKECRSRWSPYH